VKSIIGHVADQLSDPVTKLEQTLSPTIPTTHLDNAQSLHSHCEGTNAPTRSTSHDPSESMDLLQGTLDVLILKTLSWDAMHGYAISRWIRQRTDEVLTVEDAALYQALHRLERKGLIESEWGLSENNRRAKYYQLTAAGRNQLRAEATEWRQYAEAVFKVLETA
jgi:PadR family transcriptional regulator PadR